MKRTAMNSLAFVVFLCLIGAQAQVIPLSNARIEDKNFVWEVTEIEFRDDCTIVKKQVTPKTSGTWICSTTNEFIEDTENHIRFAVIWSSLGFDNPHSLYSTDPVNFTEIYEPIGKAQRVNIYSGSEYYAKAIDTHPFYTSFPMVDKPYDGAYCKTSITGVAISNDLTFVSMDYYSYYDNGWVSFAPDISINNPEVNFLANILALYLCDENGYIVAEKNLGERYNVVKNERNRIMMVFPRIPSGIHSVNIVEPNGFYWYGIQINNIN